MKRCVYGWQYTGIISIQKVEVRGSRGDGFRSEREDGLVEDDMTRDDDPVAGKVKTPVPFVEGGISQENT